MNAMMQSYARQIHFAGNNGTNDDGSPKVMSWADAIRFAGTGNADLKIAGIIDGSLGYNIYNLPNDQLYNGIYLSDDAQIKSDIAGDLDWFKGYIRAMEEGTPFEVTLPQVRRDLCIMDAFRESARTGKAVPFEA